MSDFQSRKQQILNAAAILFHKNGYKGTSLQTIAKAVGMEGPSLYNHIKSKNEILSILLLNNARRFKNRMIHIEQSSLTALKKIESLISLHIELTIENPDAMALMLQEWTHLDEVDKKEYLELKEYYEHHFLAILKDSIAKGELINMDVKLMMFLILSTLRSLYAWCAKYTDYNRIELESNVKHGILMGIVTK